VSGDARNTPETHAAAVALAREGIDLEALVHGDIINGPRSAFTVDEDRKAQDSYARWAAYHFPKVARALVQASEERKRFWVDHDREWRRSICAALGIETTPNVVDAIMDLREQRDTLVEALRWYADSCNWYGTDDDNVDCAVDSDWGDKARAALRACGVEDKS
jgi:hypothetical protein